jgi:hypothetical protein
MCSPAAAVKPNRQPPLNRLIDRNHETFNRFATDKSIHNFRNVSDCDAPIKKVIWFDKNCDAGVALIQTAGCTHARLELGQSACSNFLFQRPIHFFGVLGRAASFRVVLGAPIDADKEVVLALQK